MLDNTIAVKAISVLLTLLPLAVSIPARNTTRPNASAMHRFKCTKRCLILSSFRFLFSQNKTKLLHKNREILT